MYLISPGSISPRIFHTIHIQWKLHFTVIRFLVIITFVPYARVTVCIFFWIYWNENHIPYILVIVCLTEKPNPWFSIRSSIDQSHRCGHRQAACREPAGSYDKTTRTAICFEHKTQYLLIRAPYTRIVVFWHISKIPPMIGQSQISCNTPTFCIATIFVKYCYTTGSWLL